MEGIKTSVGNFLTEHGDAVATGIIMTIVGFIGGMLFVMHVIDEADRKRARRHS